MVRKTYGFPPDYWDTYPAKIMAVTAEDLQRVARQYLDPDTMQLVAVGDADKIKPALEKYGRVEVYDSTGNLAPVSKTE
jgi:zinc protease